MYYVYVLKSLSSNRVYVGYSADLKERYNSHKEGKVKSTKGYLPWKLAYYESYSSKLDATKREKQLKMHAVKSALVEQIKLSLA